MRTRMIAISCVVAVVSAMVFVTGCGKKEVQTAPQMTQYPDWVLKGSAAFSGDRGKVFRGVGSVSGVKNVGLARDAADAKARTEIAKVFSTYVENLMKMYQRSTTAGDMTASSEEQDVMQATKAFTKMDVKGAEVVDRFFDSQNNTWYALAEIDFAAWQEFAAGQKELNGKIRDYVRQNAEKAFDELEKESAKHQ